MIQKMIKENEWWTENDCKMNYKMITKWFQNDNKMNTKVRKKPLVKFTSHKEEMKEKGGGKEEEERKKKREKWNDSSEEVAIKREMMGWRDDVSGIMGWRDDCNLQVIRFLSIVNFWLLKIRKSKKIIKNHDYIKYDSQLIIVVIMRWLKSFSIHLGFQKLNQNHFFS